MSRGQELQTVISISGVMSPELKRAVQSVEKQLQGIDNNAIKAAQSIGKNLTAAAKTAAKAVGGLAAAGAGLAAGAFVKGGNDYIRTLNGIAAQTGATGAELEELKKIATDVYKSGKGENFQDVADALISVKQASGLAGEELKAAANAGVLLKDTFGMEYEETTRAATALMKNFGISSEEAYGIIAKGAQSGANKNGDLLDTLNEYSVHYKALGLNAEQFVSSLIKGAEAGSFSIDKVGDAVKEFTIRSKDGSKASTAAFEDLGLNADSMTKQFAAGGRTAEAAFFQVVKALDAMQDPVKKNEIGVALFGTQFEDLEAGALKTFASMQGASVDAAGALREIEKVKYKDAGYALSQIGRTIETSLLPAAESVGTTLYDQMPAIEGAAQAIVPILSDMGQQFAKALPGIIEGIGTAVQAVASFGSAVADNWGIIEPILMAAGGIWAASKVIGLAKSAYGLVKAIGALTAAYGRLNLAKLKDMVATGQIMALYAKDAIATGLRTIKTWAFVAALKAQNLAIGIGNGLTKAWSAISTAASIATRALGAAMAFLTSPIGLVVLAIGAAVAAGVWLWKNWDMVAAKAAEVGAWIAEKWAQLKEWLWGIMTGIGTSITTKWAEIKESASLIVSGMVAALSLKWQEIKTAVSNVFGAIGTYLTTKWTNIKNTVSNLASQLGDFVGNVWTSMLDAVKGFGQGIQDKLSGAFSAIPGLLKAPINAAIRLINSAIGAINGVGFTVPDWVPGMGGKAFSVNIPQIPMLAAGGFTNGVSIAGEAGREAVISFDPAYRAQNIGYLNKAAAMLGLERATGPSLGYYAEKIDSMESNGTPLAASNSVTTYNLGGVTFAPQVTIAGDGKDSKADLMELLRNAQGELRDLIEELLQEKEAGGYSARSAF